MDKIDCLVLSGGGAKGAYGAGVAKALFEYRNLVGIKNPICYVGASAGALNAYMLAANGSDGADRLIDLWRRLNNKAVLGYKTNHPKLWGAWRSIKQSAARILREKQPFGIYSGEPLRSIIQSEVNFTKLAGQRLIVAATDYTQSKLKAFCALPELDHLVKDDLGKPEDERRLQHWRRIDSGTLCDALLASAAIPVFFPPVQVTALEGYLDGAKSIAWKSETAWHIDGGVGNNTPTREAAYFLRRGAALNLCATGDVYCVELDPQRALVEGEHDFAMFGIIERTLEVYHRVHTEPIIEAWSRINREVRDQNDKLNKVIQWIQGQPGINGALFTNIEQELRQQLSPRRINVELIRIGPSSSLGDDSLDFAPGLIEENIRRGYSKLLDVLEAKGKITSAQKIKLNSIRIFRAVP